MLNFNGTSPPLSTDPMDSHMLECPDIENANQTEA